MNFKILLSGIILNLVYSFCSAAKIDVIVDGIKYQCENDEASVIGSSEKVDSAFVKDTIIADGNEYIVTSINSLPYPNFVYLPNTIKKIGKNAFGNRLNSINIPSSVEYIEKDAFWNVLGKLNRVDIDDISSWCNIEFADEGANPFFANMYYLLHAQLYLYVKGEKITDLIIPENVVELKKYVFLGYELLENVSIPNSVLYIRDYAFRYCKNLKNVTIPNSVQKIGNSAFDSCDSLKTITLGNNIKEIGNYAFDYCNKVTTVNCYSTIPPVIFERTFYPQIEYDGILHVPVGTKDLYASSQYWSKFSAIIDDLEYEAGIDNVQGLQDDNIKIYNVNGIFCGDNINNLKRGLYLIKQNNNVKKVFIP